MRVIKPSWLSHKGDHPWIIAADLFREADIILQRRTEGLRGV